MAKKNFNDNPAMEFISKETIERVDGPGSEKEYQADTYPERKTRRAQIIVQPTVYGQIEDIAKVNGISTNEAICRAIHEYVERNK